MKNLIAVLFITFFSVVYSQGQNLTAFKINNISFDGDQFLGYDPFGFYYTTKNNIFSKISSGEVLEYKNIYLGKITKVDLQNPLKIVLFYENFNTAILLDNQLNEIQKINFSEYNTPIVTSAIGIASQNQLWIYNTMNQQLGLYEYLKNDYKTISVPFTEAIKYYTSDFNTFHWINPKNLWYAADIFGNVKFKDLIPDFDNLQIISENQYLYSKSGILTLRDLVKNENYQVKSSEKNFSKFYYKGQILSIFTAEGITNYKIIIP